MSFITVDDAKEMITLYKSQRPNLLASGYPVEVLPLNITFDKDEIIKMLSQKGCVKLRAYLGMQKDKVANVDVIDLVLVGVNEENRDIIPEEDYLIVDHGTRCPYTCPPSSVINP